MPRTRLTLDWEPPETANDCARARLPELDLYVYAATLNEALITLGVLLIRYFEEHKDAGDLEQVLSRAGELENLS